MLLERVLFLCIGDRDRDREDADRVLFVLGEGDRRVSVAYC